MFAYQNPPGPGLSDACPLSSVTQWRDFLAKSHQGSYFPSLHSPPRTEKQDCLNISFLNLGNARSPLPCNTTVCLIHNVLSWEMPHSFPPKPRSWVSKGIKNLGRWGTIAQSWQPPPGCFSNVCQRQGEVKRCGCLLVSLEQKHLFA